MGQTYPGKVSNERAIYRAPPTTGSCSPFLPSSLPAYFGSMELLPQHLAEQLPPLYSQDGNPDAPVVVKRHAGHEGGRSTPARPMAASC